MGLLTVKLFLETYGLLPANVARPDRAGAVYLACQSAAQRAFALEVARSLRGAGLPCEVDLEFQKLGRQIARADAKGYPRVAIVGESEAAARAVTLKTLATGRQETVACAELATLLAGPAR
jgi:histidyl-tRNA synthetase